MTTCPDGLEGVEEGISPRPEYPAMANVRTYSLIYVALLVLGTGKFAFSSF